MDVRVVQGAIQEAEADAIVVNLFEGAEPGGATGAVDAALEGAIGELVDGGDFGGKAGEVAVLYPRAALPARRVILVGLGAQDDFSADQVRRARSQRPGEVFVVATESLDETAYRRTLGGLIRDESLGIVNPWTGGASGAAEPEGEAGEWNEGLEDLEPGELHRLAPKRLAGGDAFERSLPEGNTTADPSALDEIAAVDASVADAIAEAEAEHAAA